MYNYELLLLIVMKCLAHFFFFEFLLWFGCPMAPGLEKDEIGKQVLLIIIM